MAGVDFENLRTVTIRATWENKKAMRAFNKVLEVLEDVAEDFPYRGDVQNAVKAARYAAKHLRFDAKEA